MGLLAIAAYSTLQRQKEIGVRKVPGGKCNGHCQANIDRLYQACYVILYHRYTYRMVDDGSFI
ncbi:hypothetical protein RYH73_19535 [Olivibacter sp. CPCC 100613]|uniref:hypothetical protein n=1 Tax=Olivibacter sp. CPCC 100613 TaxID=3079931 RepID=UPI002FF59C87